METEAFSESVGLTENARREIAGQERYRMKKTDYITMQLATVFSKQLKTSQQQTRLYNITACLPGNN